jgi:hypothetical protein
MIIEALRRLVLTLQKLLTIFLCISVQRLSERMFLEMVRMPFRSKPATQLFFVKVLYYGDLQLEE